MGEISREKSRIDIPSFRKIRKIQSGITTYPEIEMVYMIQRGTETEKFFRDFYNNDEAHDCEIVRTDATGAEFKRTLLPGCECVIHKEPGYDAASPEYAKTTLTFVPWDIIDVD